MQARGPARSPVPLVANPVRLCSSELTPIAAEGTYHLGRMGDVEDRQPIHEIWVVGGDDPGDGRASVVADEVGSLAPEGVDQVDDVAGERFGVVGRRLPGEAVAALVGRDDKEPGLCEGRDLVAPAVPVLGEAVEEDDEVTRLGPGGRGVELEAGQVEAESGEPKRLGQAGENVLTRPQTLPLPRSVSSAECPKRMFSDGTLRTTPALSGRGARMRTSGGPARWSGLPTPGRLPRTAGCLAR